MERRVLDLLARGSVVSLISDAGTPGISDPGAALVAVAAAASHRVTTVPGATALVAALVGSGLPTAPFMFLGFPPPKAGARRRQLQELAGQRATLLFYIAPHDLLAFLNDAVETLGPARRCCIARELTKLHEEYWRSSLAQARAEFGSRAAVRGEVVLVVEGAGEAAEAGDDEVLGALQAELHRGQSPSAAAKSVASALNVSRKRAYQLSLQLSSSTGVFKPQTDAE